MEGNSFVTSDDELSDDIRKDEPLESGSEAGSTISSRKRSSGTSRPAKIPKVVPENEDASFALADSVEIEVTIVLEDNTEKGPVSLDPLSSFDADKLQKSFWIKDSSIWIKYLDESGGDAKVSVEMGKTVQETLETYERRCDSTSRGGHPTMRLY